MKIAFVFSGPWSTWAPSYAMSLLKAGAKQRNHDFIGFDFNIDFYNHVDETDKNFWIADKYLNEEEKELWKKKYPDDSWKINASLYVNWSNPKFVESMVNKYSNFIDDYVDKIIKTNAPLCAFSVVGFESIFSRLIAKKIKEKKPSIFIIFGGPTCFRHAEGLHILNDLNVDAICTGEADYIWPDFLDLFEKNNYKLNGTVEGIAYRSKDESIIDGGNPTLVSDLDTIPFADYDDIDFSKYTLSNRIPLMTSRGCINRCAFCVDHSYKKFRFRSAENLFKEVKKQVNLLRSKSDEIPHINFNDLLINGYPALLEEFCDKIIQENLKFSWGGMVVFRKEMTKELLSKMKQAGCVELLWGLESGSETVLKLMNKKSCSIEEIENIIKIVNSLEINQYPNIIVGFPGETDKLFLETVKFIARNKKYVTTFGLSSLVILENTDLYDNYKKYGIENPVFMEWKTADNKNNFDIRADRINILAEILEGKVYNSTNLGALDKSKRKDNERKFLEYYDNEIKQKLEKLISKNQDKKICFYGAGKLALEFVKMFDLSNLNITGFIDKNPNKTGLKIEDYYIYSLEDLEKLNPDIVILAIIKAQQVVPVLEEYKQNTGSKFEIIQDLFCLSSDK